jgi:hypothetical protein
MTRTKARWFGFALLAAVSATATAAPIYIPGTSTPLAACPTCVVGTHLAEGPNGSVAGTGGSGISVPGGSTLNGQRTYIYDRDYTGYAAGAAVARGAGDFAMLVWDMGVAMNTMRLYTHQDHYGGGPISDPFVAQDVMEYSVWGSNDNVTFVLLSDVTAFDIDGEGPGLPTYTFLGEEPSFVYRGGSAEFGAVNAYTRDYTFANNYRYYGVRSSLISARAQDADPEIDAIVGNPGPINRVPEPGMLTLLGLGLLSLMWMRRRTA